MPGVRSEGFVAAPGRTGQAARSAPSPHLWRIRNREAQEGKVEMITILRKYRVLSFVLLVVIIGGALLAARGHAPAPAPVVVPPGAKAGDLNAMTSCPYQAEGSKTIFEAQCGTLTVPENWEKAGSRLIALPVVRIPATGPNPTEPVFWLVGGPGGSNLSWEPPAWLLAKHDVVLVGYRGEDGSEILTCPEVARSLKAHLGVDLWSQQARDEQAAAVKQCAARLQADGVDLSGYTMPDVVQDMEAARQGLGYDRIDLFSESYGTRVAQTYAYMRPQSLRRVIQVGVNTPGHFLYDPAVIDKMIGRISQLCAQDASCSSRTSNFAQTMYTVTHNMPRRWLFFNIDPDTVRLGSQFLLYSDADISTIVDMYLAAGQGDASGLAMGNLMAKLMVPADAWRYGDIYSKGGSADMDKDRGIESISLGDHILGAPHTELVFPMASEWPIELIPEQLRELQESDVEMLLINGTLDFSTPPTALDEAKPYWHKAQMVLLPEFSHVGDEYTLQQGAFERLITSYLDTGVGDASLYVYQPLSFKPAMSLPRLAKILAAAVVVLPLVLALIIFLVIRRIRRRRFNAI